MLHKGSCCFSTNTPFQVFQVFQVRCFSLSTRRLSTSCQCFITKGYVLYSIHSREFVSEKRDRVEARSLVGVGLNYMQIRDTNSYKTGGSCTDKQNNVDSDTKPCTVVNKNGEKLCADHHWIDGQVVHACSGAMRSGITRTISLNTVKRILRGVSR